MYQSKDREHTLKTMEPYFINEYDSFNNGYNSTIGGEGTLGIIVTEEHKNKIGKANRGKIRSQETKEQIIILLLQKQHLKLHLLKLM